MCRRHQPGFMAALFGPLLQWPENTVDRQGSSGYDVLPESTDNLGVLQQGMLNAIERQHDGCAWLFHLPDGVLVAAGDHAQHWHQPIASWHDIDPLIHPDQANGPIDLGQRVLCVEWSVVSSDMIILCLKPPTTPQNLNHGTAQFCFDQQSAFLDSDAQAILDWDQPAIQLSEFVEQIVHPEDHDRVSQLFNQSDIHPHPQFHFRVIGNDGQIIYCQFLGEISPNGRSWWGSLQQDHLSLPELYRYMETRSSYHEQKTLRHHVVLPGT